MRMSQNVTRDNRLGFWGTISLSYLFDGIQCKRPGIGDKCLPFNFTFKKNILNSTRKNVYLLIQFLSF